MEPRKYRDFELRIAAGGEGGHTVTVLHSLAGEAEASVRFPLQDPGFRALLESTGGDRGFEFEEFEEDAEAPAAEASGGAEELGRQLFEILMQGEVRSSYRTSLDKALSQGEGLRLRLRIDAPELATLPWEQLHDEKAGDFIALDVMTPVVRHPEVTQSAEPLLMPRPLRILGLISSPKDRAELQVEKERRDMEDALAHLRESGDVEIHWIQPEKEGETTLEDLAREIGQGPWHVFHFIGHGGFDEASGEGFIALCDTQEGKTRRVSGQELARALGIERRLRLAVLNCCEGARASETNLFSSIGSILVRGGIPAVVSMQEQIRDEAAIELARSFYTALADGKGVDEATAEARRDIEMAFPHSSQWWIPVLYLRLEDGFLFRVDDERHVFTGPAEERKALAPVRRQTYHFDVASLWPLAVTVTESEASRSEAESELLAKVRSAWIQGRLEAWTRREVRAHSELTVLAGDSSGAAAEEAPESKTPERSLLEVFDEAGGSLLILGDPGAGKGLRLLQLARDLISRAEDDPRQPIPVVVPLSDRACEAGGLESYLVDELARQYQVPRVRSRRWLRQRLLLPVLDGLDTVSVSRRAPCVEAINAFARHAPGVVVACRRVEYTRLPVRLDLNRAVLVHPLTGEQVLGELGEEDAGLRALLAKDSALRLAARSPLVLSFLIEMARRLPVEKLRGSSSGNAVERRREVVQAFVDDAFERAGTSAEGKNRVLSRLSWLAKRMKDEGQSLFFVEQLQVGWLRSSWQRFGVLALFGAVVGCAAAVAMFLAWWLSERADPNPMNVHLTLVHWLGVSVLWALGAQVMDRLRKRFFRPRPPQGAFAELRRHVKGTAVYFTAWMLFWIGDWALLGKGVELFRWLHQPGVAGLAFAAIYQARVGGKEIMNRIEPVEALRWRWGSAWTGFLGGSLAGFLVWLVYFATAAENLVQPDFNLNHWRFYVPIAAAVGFCFGGLRGKSREKKTTANQGMRLSLQNAGIAAAVNGSALGLVSFVTVRWIRGEKAFPVIQGDPWAQAEIGAVVAVASALVSFLWFGGLDFLRHWILRLFLAIDGPRHLVALVEEAVRLGFMDRAGGGYVFIHRFVLNYFAPDEKTRPS